MGRLDKFMAYLFRNERLREPMIRAHQHSCTVSEARPTNVPFLHIFIILVWKMNINLFKSIVSNVFRLLNWELNML